MQDNQACFSDIHLPSQQRASLGRRQGILLQENQARKFSEFCKIATNSGSKDYLCNNSPTQNVLSLVIAGRDIPCVTAILFYLLNW